MVAARGVYCGAGAARRAGAADWGAAGLLYAARGHVALARAHQNAGSAPVITLHHHKGKVNAVKWIENGIECPTELVSCSGDKTAIIWSLNSDKWNASAILEGHTEGVTCADALYPDKSDIDHLLIYTCSIDSTVRIWERKENIVKCIQTISLGTGLCLTLRAHLMPIVDRPVLFCALDDDKIYLFVETASDDVAEYHKVTALVGHEDWVRGLDVITIKPGSLLLASCSQDTYIRLWSIKLFVAQQECSSGIRVEQKLFTAYERSWSSKLEAVLSGHEGWVYGVHWHPPHIHTDGSIEPVYKLLSSSLDKTLIIWEPDVSASGDTAGEGVWVERVRVGEVGGNGLGFYGCKFGPGGNSFMGHGYNGSFHIWTYNEESNQWEPSVVCGGHFGEVVDVRWEPGRGRYVTSVSTDQTTRIHAPWSRPGVHPDQRSVEWHEIARPQVHGFDMSSLALVSSTLFVSAAEEKVIRVFEAPHNFVQNFKNITQMELVADDDGARGPEGASVPSLGLSNKAVFSDDSGTQDGDDKGDDRYFVPVHMTEPPTEETLMQNTLWPETQKLYGHGYEVYALDASPDGALIASACRATSAEHAAVLLWDTKQWRQIQKLSSHQLTVTQLSFSPDSARLLCVSRDRRWSLFRRDGGDAFELEATTDKNNGIHTRIIWTCAWTHDSGRFATGSRDGKVCVWGNVGSSKPSSLGPYGLADPLLEIPNASVTALAFAPVDVRDDKMLAVGFEAGNIRIYLVSPEKWTLAFEFDHNAAHNLTVKRLAFRPVQGSAGLQLPPPDDNSTLQLASCGSDHLLRIYEIYV